MAGLKYSKQRASIKDYLMHTTSHPTADTVYLHIKEEFPSISLGTVYRNLNLLADIGEALRIPTPDGGDRFDGRCEPHYHVVCTNCGNVFDLEMDDSYIQKINEDANKYFDGIIESHTYNVLSSPFSFTCLFFELVSAYATYWTFLRCSFSFINISAYCTYKFFHSVVLLFFYNNFFVID